MGSKKLQSALLAILFLAFEGPADAQVIYGSIVGAVRDATDAAVPSAERQHYQFGFRTDYSHPGPADHPPGSEVQFLTPAAQALRQPEGRRTLTG
jgi:hypothetical protein